MKVTKVEVLQIKTVSPGWRPVVCRVYTDEGIYGDGEACLAFGKGSSAAFGMVRDLASMIIGEDPMDTERIWQKLYEGSTWGYNGGPVVFAGISALDIALWDIKAKAFGVPVYKLLGGKTRDSVRAYASQLQHGWRPDLFTFDEFDVAVGLEDYAATAQCAIDEGFDAVKVDLLERENNGDRLASWKQNSILTGDVLELAVERMDIIRKTVGPDVSIIVEAHSHNSATGAVQIANALEKFDVFFYEEPNTPNPQTARYIAAHTNVPMASGERIYSRWQFAPYLTDGTLRVIQPDIGTSGGFTEVKKICDMAMAYDVFVQPHVCGTPLATSIALQLEAVIPNFIIHEHNSNLRSKSATGLTKYNPQPVNGRLAVPEEPGLGNELTEGAYEQATCIATVTKDENTLITK